MGSWGGNSLPTWAVGWLEGFGQAAELAGEGGEPRSAAREGAQLPGPESRDQGQELRSAGKLGSGLRTGLKILHCLSEAKGQAQRVAWGQESGGGTRYHSGPGTQLGGWGGPDNRTSLRAPVGHQ